MKNSYHFVVRLFNIIELDILNSEKLNNSFSGTLKRLLLFIFFAFSVANAFSQTAVFAPIIHQNGAKVVQTTDNLIEVDRPDFVVAGDLILFLCSSNRFDDFYSTIPAGVILYYESSLTNANTRARVYYKIATNNEPDTYQFVLTGNSSIQGNTITAVRVTNYNSSNIFGSISDVNSGDQFVDNITIPGLNLTQPSTIVAFTASRSVINSSIANAPLTLLTSPGGIPGYISGFQQNLPIGPTGTRSFSWSSERRTVALMFSLNPLVVNCNSVTGSILASTGGVSFVNGTGQVTVTGLPQNLPVGSYLVTYNLSGSNVANNQIATGTVTQAGTMVFQIPGNLLTNIGTTQVTITMFNYEPNQCNTIVQVTSNNVATHEIVCGIASLSTSIIGQAGQDQLIYVTGEFIPGVYTVTFNLSGANTAVNQTATVTLSENGGVFIIDGSLLPNNGLTNVTITSFQSAIGCPIVLPNSNSTSFTNVSQSPNPYSLQETGLGCGYTGLGCPQTNFNNSFMGSWNDPNSIEYDNFISVFHSSLVRTNTGEFEVWGQKIANDGVNNLLSPTVLNSSNFPALGNHQVLKVAAGSSGGGVSSQFIALTTDGLYVWGEENAVVSTSLTSSNEFQKMGPTNGNLFSLPPGVSPVDVKMLFGSFELLAITTCTGEVWVLANGNSLQHKAVRGNGGAGVSSSWSQVHVGPNQPLTDVIVVRGNGRHSLIALKTDNTIWTWGRSTYLGDNTDPLIRSYATQMVHPDPSKTIKMIGMTGSASNISYYVLMTDGNLFALGHNESNALGDFTNTTRLNWIQPKYNSANGPTMNNIHWISPQEHDGLYRSINVLTKQAKLYAWGRNNQSMIGRGAVEEANPGIPDFVAPSDEILSVETGGHTSMIFKKCENNFGYVGHRASGSMGNGDAAGGFENAYTFNTAQVEICGSPEQPVLNFVNPLLGENGTVCVGVEYDLFSNYPGGTFSSDISATFSGTTVVFNQEGSGTITYTYLNDCQGQEQITLDFTAINTDLEVTVNTTPEIGPVGSTVIVTIVASNLNSGSEVDAIVNAQIPSGFMYVSHLPPAQGVYDPISGVWTLGNLIQNQSETLEITVEVNPEPANYTFSTSISGDNCEHLLVNNQDSAIFTVGCINPEIEIQPETPFVFCDLNDITGISVTASGFDLSYQWYVNTVNSSIGGMAITGATDNDFTPNLTSPGTYYFYVVVTSSDSCHVSSDVSEFTWVNAEINSPTSICDGEDAVFSISGTPGAIVTYNLNGGNNDTFVLSSDNYDVLISSPSSNQTLNILTFEYQGMVFNDCPLNSTVQVLPSPDVSFVADTTVGYPNLVVTFVNTSNFGSTNFVWDFNGQILNSNETTITQPFNVPGIYNVVLTGDLNGCTASDTIQIIINEFDPPEIIAPNVFSPNGDGVNDFWQFVTLNHVVEMKLRIVNRWGNLFFESSELVPTWNGKSLDGSDATEGVYFYKYNVRGLDGEFYEGQGFLHLVLD